MKVRYGSVTVNYTPSLDGGGTLFRQDFVPVVRKLFGRVSRICEFAAGPGFVGFSLLGQGLCDSLCLTDVNPEAIEACQQTIKENHLEGAANAYLSDGLKQIPETEAWDLVVSNPPHFRGEYIKDLINVDSGWKLHREFYRDISRFAKPGASILFCENLKGSSPRMWQRMIAEAGLEFVKCFRPIKITQPNLMVQRATGVYRPTDYRSIGYEAFRWRLREVNKAFHFSRFFSYVVNAERATIDRTWREIDRYPYYFVWSKVIS